MIHVFSSECFAFVAFFLFTLMCVFLRAAAGVSLVSCLAYMLLIAVPLCRYIASDCWRPYRSRGDMASLRRRRAVLVVGASSGVGYGIAESLALDCFDVLLAGRSLPRLLAARRQIEERLARQGSSSSAAAAAAKGSVKVLDTVDLSSEKSVRAFAASAQRSGYPLGTLVLAAGMLASELRYAGDVHPNTGLTNPLLTPPDSAAYNTYRNSVLTNPSQTPYSFTRQKDEARDRRLHDGFADVEVMLAANALGPLLLAELLLPVLEETARRTLVASRVVFLASSCHTFLGLGAAWRAVLSTFRPPTGGGGEDRTPLTMIEGLERWRAAEHRQRAAGAGAEKTGVEAGAEKTLPQRPEFSGMGFVGYYGLSKLCAVYNAQLLQARVAASRTSRGAVLVTAAHPGIIASRLYRELFPQWALDYLIYVPSLLLGKTWREGALTAVRLVRCPEVEVVPGAYYAGCERPHEANFALSHYARDKRLRDAYDAWAHKHMARDTPAP